jgi:hypothetical protein
MSGLGRLLLIRRSAATQRPHRRPASSLSTPHGHARAAGTNAITQVIHRDSRWRSVRGAILGDVADRDDRLIIRRQLNPELRSAVRPIRTPRAAHSEVLTGSARDHAQLQGPRRGASDPGLTLLEARAIDIRSQRGLKADPPRREIAPGAARGNCNWVPRV